MEALKPTERTRLRRYPKRGSFDRDVLYSIIDRALVCHVAFVADGSPFVLPTLHVRIGDSLFVHGSTKNHMLASAIAGGDICVTLTHIDGLVLARSAFHHSVNYRSAVVLGRAGLVTDPARKSATLLALVDHVAPGRSTETRAPAPDELDATMMIELPIDEASAKIRDDGVLDSEPDYALPHWAGIIPLRLTAGTPIPDQRLDPSIAMPRHVSEYRPPDSRASGRAHDGAVFERQVDEFVISTDAARLDLGVIHGFLATSYWAEGIPRETVARAIANSLCFGIYDGTRQVGFARVVSDYATFAYIADVFVIESYRGRGLSKALMAAVMSHPHLQGFRRWLLGTKDAHGLYSKFGFDSPLYPDRQMERADPDIYRRAPASAAK